MILIDIDGVCLDLLGAVKERNSLFNPDMVLSYDFSEGNYGITKEEVLQYLQEEETFRLEKPRRGTKYGIQQLKTLDSVYGWTYVPEHIVNIRKRQLKQLSIDGVIDTQYPKQPIFEDVKVVIEDNPEMLKLFAGNNNIIKILIRQSYNITYKDYDYCVANLKEAYELLRKEGIYNNERQSIFGFGSTCRNIFRCLSEKGKGIIEKVSS